MKPAKIVSLIFAIAVGGVMLFGNDRAALIAGAPVLSTAEAVIGRPLTPLSYAGVARRTTRRAVVAGAAVGAAVAAPVVVAPACVQRVDAYGRVYAVCP